MLCSPVHKRTLLIPTKGSWGSGSPKLCVFDASRETVHKQINIPWWNHLLLGSPLKFGYLFFHGITDVWIQSYQKSAYLNFKCEVLTLPELRHRYLCVGIQEKNFVVGPYKKMCLSIFLHYFLNCFLYMLGTKCPYKRWAYWIANFLVLHKLQVPR